MASAIDDCAQSEAFTSILDPTESLTDNGRGKTGDDIWAFFQPNERKKVTDADCRQNGDKS